MSPATGGGGVNGAPEVKLNELYQEVILDHNRNPRNFRKLEDATAVAHGVNPLCGDHFDVYLVKDASGKLVKVSFEGDGCAISKASASLMTQAVEGKVSGEASKLKDHFIHLLTDPEAKAEHREGTGRLKFLEGVRNFPIRVKCATLAWRALEQALKGNNEDVSTE
jgi:nitrogen fixation protein NifU and related proteins